MIHQDEKVNNENFIETIQFYKETLDAHNELRSYHNAKELCLNLKLCKIAQDSAARYASSSSVTSNKEKIYDQILGENIAFQFSNSQDLINGLIITRIWYNEIKGFNFLKPIFSPVTSHFTQIIWKNTTDIGFGRARGKDGSCYMVAVYFPAGNIPNEFEANIEGIK